MASLHLLIERAGMPPLQRTIAGEAAIVGRSDSADITIDDSSVSRRHARLFARDSGWFIEDLGSRNGTDVNGARLAKALRLNSGDIIAIGGATLRVTASDDRARPGFQPTSTAVARPVEDASVFSVLRPASELLHPGGEEKTASSRLRLLNEIHRALAAPFTRDELLQMILERAFASLQPEQAAIFLRQSDGQLYRAAERQSAAASVELLVSRRLEEEIVVQGKAALVLDAQSDARFAQAQSVLASGMRSILAAPLSDAEGCLGMIALYSRLHARRFSEEDLEVLVSIASAAAMRIRNIDLAEAAAQRRVLDREIALAHDIQMDMLRLPPERSEVELAADLVPAHSVGGDFYDFFLDGNRLWFIVADVSGKGMGAALMMAVGQTLFRAVAGSGLPVSEAIARMNRELARDNDRAMFITALGGCLDLASGRLELVNAGHNLPYQVRADGSVQLLPAKNSLALGVIEDAVFPTTEILLGKGDAVLIYTDGVCDAVNAAGKSFGTENLERALCSLARRPASDVVGGLCGAVKAFAGATPQEDDITVAMVRYRGQVSLVG